MGTGRFFVVGQDGTRYGPADVTTLNVWAAEGRVSSASLLEEEGTGRQVPASRVPGLSAVRPGPDPFAGAYPRPHLAGGSSKELQTAWVLGALSVAAGAGILCTPIGAIGGIVAGAFGIRFASQAERAGHPNAKGARVLNIVGLVLCGLQFLALPFMFLSN